MSKFDVLFLLINENQLVSDVPNPERPHALSLARICGGENRPMIEVTAQPLV